MEETNFKKDNAREKVLLFAIGVLVGAVISAVSFFVCVKALGVNNNSSSQQMPGGTPPEMPSGENGQGGTPPEKPSNSDDSNN